MVIFSVSGGFGLRSCTFEGILSSIHVPSIWMVYGCPCAVCKGRARWNRRDYDVSSLRPRSRPPTPCVLIDRFKSGLKNRLQGRPAGPRFKAGVMAIVTEGGEVSPGDRIRAGLPAPPHLDLP